jgi:DNA polymerase
LKTLLGVVANKTPTLCVLPPAFQGAFFSEKFMLSIDFETFSAADLTKVGAYRYATDPSTGAYMLAWAVDDKEPEIWLPADEEPPELLITLIEQGQEVWAFNAAFERLIWNHVICRDFYVPEIRISQTRCTAALCRVNALPGNLADAAKALGAPLQKNTNGQRLIREYSCKNIPWSAVPDIDRQAFIEYCLQDVRTERALKTCCRPLTDTEWQDYHLTEQINDQGIPVDLDFAAAAIKNAGAVRQDAVKDIMRITQGQVDKPTSRKRRDQWLQQHLPSDVIEEITTDGKIKFDKDTRARLLADSRVKGTARDFIAAVHDSGSSVLTKYETMLTAHIDGKVHGAFLFNGGHTGRMSSRLLQVQNLRRDVFDPDTAETLMTRIIEGAQVDNMSDTLARLVRPTIYSSTGMTVYDWSSIENRVLAWLAGNEDDLQKIEAGVDLYKDLAANIYHAPIDTITAEQRQLGKIGLLSCGFGGGQGAINKFSELYNIPMIEDLALQIRDGYRITHPKEVQLWNNLASAAYTATMRPRTAHKVNFVSFEHDGTDLWLQLPSGRFMRYHEARIEEITAPWGDSLLAVTCKDTRSRPKQGETDWPRVQLGRHILVENCVQAIAADILREALRQAAHFDIFLVCHDEIAVLGDHPELQTIMETVPTWAPGLPLAAAGGFSYAYGK